MESRQVLQVPGHDFTPTNRCGSRIVAQNGSIYCSGYSFPDKVKDSVDFVLPVAFSGPSRATFSSYPLRRSSNSSNQAQIRRATTSDGEDLSDCSNAVTP